MSKLVQDILSRRVVTSVLSRLLIVTCLAVAGFTFLRAAHAGEPEFGGLCIMGLAEGKRIKTNCTVKWEDKDGKTYCFASEDSKTAFLEDPHGNLERAKEHFAAGDVEGTGDEMGKFTAEDVTQFTDEEIKSASEKNGGVYTINDAMAGQSLALVYDKIDFVRTLHGYGFFPDVIFHAKDDAAKTYLIDFWVRPHAGKLSIMDVRIYKAPSKEGDKWVMITRQPKPWWWIPASEHPGKSETKRGWEVMSALDEYVLAERAKSGGIFKLRDDKTGEELALDFIGIHQPVRRLKDDGRFFACTDFRKQGSKDEYYDIDFWLDSKTGRIAVGEVRVHKVPVLEDGNYVQKPRYNFDSKTFDVVP
jgi:YHS domain-containing protein